MQHHDEHDFAPAPQGQQAKVAIPYLARPERTPATKTRFRNKDRVPRACRNCHKRKVKCSGDYPRCSFCEKVNKPCVYDATRKDRLATATERNEQLVTLLNDLTGRVNDDDRTRIESALNDSDNEYDSLSQHAESSRRQSISQTSPLPILSPTNDRSFATAPYDNSHDVDVLIGDGIRPSDRSEAIYLGQVCEVQWLRHLKARTQHRGPNPVSMLMALDETNFYGDKHGIQLLQRDNPFYLPPEQVAATLFQCYFQTVHMTFPIVSVDFDHQLRIYYESMKDGQAVSFTQRWYAIVNLVFAIGARFSRLIQAEWQSNRGDETVYLSRAYQLLGLSDPAIVLGDTDLALIEATGLLALYYTTIGHVDRAWSTIGTAVRLAVGMGLHTRSQTLAAPPDQRQVMIQIWWNVHNLDSLLSLVTGRLSMLRSEDITTPLPSEVSEQQAQKGPEPVVSFPDAQVRHATIQRKVLSKLYTEQKVARSWAQIHAIIPTLMSDLHEWASEAISDNIEAWQASANHSMQQILLKKQYCRMKILITRPALRRIELCFENSSDDYTPFDLEVAEACIQTAQEVASLFPSEIDLKAMYEKGPWWIISHNIMQASAVFLIAISCRKHFESLYASSVSSLKKLVMWLRYMRHSNDTAKRGYLVLYGIVKAPNLADPFVWADISGMFPEEQAPPPPTPIVIGPSGPNAFGSWPGSAGGMGFEGGGFEYQ